MYNQRTRYCTTILALDRINYCFNFACWDNDAYQELIEIHYKHEGLHLINESPCIYIRIEYLNIIWDYKVFFGSCKKKYKKLDNLEDERWQTIDKYIYDDLKRMGLEELYEDVLLSIKSNKYYEFKDVRNIQFKKYCIIEEIEHE